MSLKKSKKTSDSVWSPLMVVNPGENLVEAIGRHRRDTGHRGMCVVIGINNVILSGSRAPAGNREAVAA